MYGSANNRSCRIDLVRSTIGRMSSGRAVGALFVAGVGLVTLALNAIAIPESPAFQTIGACLLFAGILAFLLTKQRQDS